jgi:hypothetical protein
LVAFSYGKPVSTFPENALMGGENVDCTRIGYCVSIADASTPAQAQRIRVGNLTCTSGPSVGLIVGSRQNLRCTFRSVSTGRRYIYSGTMTRLGLDIGITGASRLFRGVFAPTTHVGHGTLRGNYVGASGDVSLGLGFGANVLVGWSRRTIAVQPLSIEGQVGVNLALGVARLTLQ